MHYFSKTCIMGCDSMPSFYYIKLCSSHVFKCVFNSYSLEINFPVSSENVCSILPFAEKDACRGLLAQLKRHFFMILIKWAVIVLFWQMLLQNYEVIMVTQP